MKSRTYLRIPLPGGLSISLGSNGSVSTSLRVGKVLATVVTRLSRLVTNVVRFKR